MAADDQYLVLARKWRPQSFEDVVGQEHITRTLRNAIATGRIHHAFLFIGSRGIGKTTTARILAKALNCLNADQPTTDPCGVCSNCTSIGAGTNMDVIEIDGASNNSVDDVREIRDNIRMVPSNARYKVYIIDEVHQLSIAAFNALLKTLEEPPPHAIFVLATTEAHKLPATIISRCQRYDFRRVSLDNLVELLGKIIAHEGVEASQEALYAIARAAEGGVRDSESILDELITYCDGTIAFKDVFDVLGLVDWHVLHTLCEAILQKDIPKLLTLVEEVVSGGKDLSQFVQDILRYFRNLLVLKTSDSAELLQLPEEEVQELRARAQQFSLTQLIRLVEQFAELTSGFDSQLAQRIALESMLIRISKVGVEISVDTILEKLIQLGQGGIAPGVTDTATPAPPPSPKPAVPESPPPENPPEAGPEAEAPADPVTRRRIELTPDNLAAGWEAVSEAAGDASFNLGIWLGSATPTGVEDGTLRLEFAAENSQARDIIARPEHRSILEQALQECTTNVTRFSLHMLAPVEDVLEKVEPLAHLPVYEPVNPEAARIVLDDAGIATVMEAFKGRIARIERNTSPSADTETP